MCGHVTYPRTELVDGLDGRAEREEVADVGILGPGTRAAAEDCDEVDDDAHDQNHSCKQAVYYVADLLVLRASVLRAAGPVAQTAIGAV